ncbi:hypothetical protein Tco_0271741 [Tanacetum coccineum]
MNFLSESLMAIIKEQVKDQLPQILPNEVSNFAPLVIEALIKESRDEVTLAKASSQPHSTYEAASTLTEFELKRILIDKMEKSESYLAAPEHRDSYDNKDKDEDRFAGSDRGLKKRKLSKDAEPTTGPKKKDSTSGSSKGTKSQPKSSGKPEFKLLKGTRSNFAELEYDFKECYKALSENLDWENPKGSDYLFDLSKPLPLITRGKHQRVPFEYFINNDLEYLQGGVSIMTYMTSTTKTKAAQYDLPGIEDKVPNIWSPVKVAYDRYALWAVTHVKVMRKHRYRYLEEIVVRRADNVLYKFKEGDFPRLRINDIEDMLILVVQNQLTNLLGDDVADFAIVLRMFTRSLVIQKRVEDLQLGVESYQKKINVTKPDTTRPYLKKRHPYTSYKYPQGFIYVDDYKRNRLMHSDELYKFCDGTLTRLISLLEEITKNIDMEYLPKRIWSTLEKKRAHFMIKDINKLLKERRMMKSLEKFVGGRLYRTNLRLLQRTI